MAGMIENDGLTTNRHTPTRKNEITARAGIAGISDKGIANRHDAPVSFHKKGLSREESLPHGKRECQGSDKIVKI